MGNNLNNAGARLSSIGWSKSAGAFGEEQAALLGLYFKKASKFLDACGSDETSAFFDASEKVAPGAIRLPEDSVELIELISTHENALTVGICRCYLKWACALDAEVREASEHADMYDPLITLLEQGVSFGGVRKGELILGEEGFEVPLAGWREQ